MKRIIANGLMATLVAIAVSGAASARAESGQEKVEAAIANFKLADPSLTNFFAKSAGYVVLPSVGEGAFLIGGERGHGLLYENDKAVGKVTLTEFSLGAQAGGGSFSEIIFFQTATALQTFKQTKYEMSGDAKATLAASGAAVHTKFSQGIAVFTLPKSGVMVAAAIGGQKFTFAPLK